MVDPGLALLVFGVLAVLALAVFWPRVGMVARIHTQLRLTERVRLEDALKHVYTCEQRGRPCTLESLAGQLSISTGRAAELIARLTELGVVHTGSRGPRLTEDGRETALRVIRTHRLWERYLADRTGVPAGEWHDEAERMEHALSANEADALAARLGHPRWDPHGDPIPTAAGDVPPLRGFGLLSAEPGRTVEVVHLEDEPPEVYAKLVAEGLGLGGRLELVERTDTAVRVRSDGREWSLAPVAAANVTVAYLPEGESVPALRRTLADLRQGETGRVTGLSPACRGAQRRRLLDLGVVPGTEITAELFSAARDPVAYRIRGALIALRREQASWVGIEPAADDSIEAA